MIQAEHLTMWYGKTRALDDVTFEIRSGEVLGLLGPNGAGKSTSLKIVTTFLAPTSGRVVVGGTDAAEDPIAVRRRIGYLPETAPLYLDMTTREYLDFVGRARGLSGAGLDRRRSTVVEACGLAPVLRRLVGHLSKGFRQRTGLAGALIHDPEILILDEPTSGLDPFQIVGIRELVRSLSRVKTIVFSSHVLQEIEAVSDRIMILNEGRLVAEGSREDLQRRAMGTDRTLVEAAAPPGDMKHALAQLPGVVAVEERSALAGGAAFAVRHAFGGSDAAAGIEALAREKGWPLRRLAPERYTLEQVFIALARPAAGDALARPAAGEAAQGAGMGGRAS